MTRAATVDADQLEIMLEKIAAISEPGPGITRMAYSPLEREAHALFTGWMEDLGCEVWADAAGNTIAELPGNEPGLPAIGTGSHLDSVYNGGRFDGIVGVLAGVELARMVKETGGLRHPLRVVVFAGEEAARFGHGCIGSRCAVGETSLQTLESVTDRDGVTLAEAMQEAGVDPAAAVSTSWSASEWGVFLELHIEQGRVLEETQCAVAPVELISGSARLMLTITGRPSHSGGTPMPGRTDALTAASEAVLIAERAATECAEQGTRATVGRLEVDPNSITTIPGSVTFSLDIRGTQAQRQSEATERILEEIGAACTRRGVGLTVERTSETPPTMLPTWIKDVLEQSVTDLGLPYKVLQSGAGHDSKHINTVVPAGMLFVPSRQGLSHVPEEWTDTGDIVQGVRALHAAVEKLDQLQLS